MRDLQTTKALQGSRVGIVLCGLNIFGVHFDAIMAHNMTQVFHLHLTKITFGLLHKKEMVLKELNTGLQNIQINAEIIYRGI